MVISYKVIYFIIYSVQFGQQRNFAKIVLILSLSLSTYTGGGETGQLSLFGNNTKPPKKSEEPCSGEGKYTSYTHYLHYVRTHTI